MQSYTLQRHLHSFPTRRSSDLIGLDIFVANGPIFSPPVLKALGLEVEWTETIAAAAPQVNLRSEEHTSELQPPYDIVCRLLLEKKKTTAPTTSPVHEATSRHR